MLEIVGTFVEEVSKWIVYLLGFMLVITFFYYLGLFGDYAKSAGITIRSRSRLILSSIIYALVFLASTLMCIYGIFGSFLADPSMFLQKTVEFGFVNIVLLLIALFMIIVGVGAFAIYIINRADTSFLQSLKLSAMLTISPLQEAIYGFSLSLLLILYYPLISIISYSIYSYVPQIPATILFAIFWCLFAIAVFFAGPSKVISFGLAIIASGLLVIVALVTLVVGLFIFPMLFALLPFLIFIVILSFVILVIAIIIRGLGIVRALGLLTLVISILLYVSFQWILSSSKSLEMLPYISYILSYVQPALSIISQSITSIFIVGIVAGILFMFFGRSAEEEEKSLISLSMAITVASALIIHFGILQFPLLPLEVEKVPILDAILEVTSLSMSFLISWVFLPIIYVVVIFTLRMVYGLSKLLTRGRGSSGDHGHSHQPTEGTIEWGEEIEW